ncbi:hypothetical protein [Bacillus thuringiensis]|uniref:hypothetical protein n=1 Tax=Bacillus thuringiensis TaxID=1428 RepID=UPI0021D64CAC|nr:hypothetical protein [Bacillus thuringiensis]MCU7679257.1 hypothetical protein [Bacillus thuringiensis]
MGDYTAFRGKVIIKEEYKELVELINSGDWEEAVDTYSFLKEYYDIKRSTLIPFSKEDIQDMCNEEGELYLQANPLDWEVDRTYFTNLIGLEWTFITCIKNYADKNHNNKTPIQSFIDVVISEVVNEIIKIQEYYPEDGTPVEYKFENVVAKTNKKAFFSRIVTRKSKKNADKIKVKKIPRKC